MHAGAAAQAGVVAAAAAHGGLSGAADVLEGPAGLAAATGVTTGWAVSRGAWGDVPALERITVKPYQCCGHAFAPIDAALELRAVAGGQEMAEILVETYATAVAVAGIAEPVSAAERRFSIPHLVAAALTHDPGDGFEPGVGPDDRLREVAGRVRLVATAEFDGRFPARRGARVTVTVAGERHTAEVPDRSGSPERPLDDRRLAEKFIAVSARGPRSAGRLLAALDDAAPETPVADLDLGAPRY
jgi:2-methylcitrate dehydratase PrpD